MKYWKEVILTEKRKRNYTFLSFIFNCSLIHCFHVGINKKHVHILNQKLRPKFSVKGKKAEKQQHKIYILSQEKILPACSLFRSCPMHIIWVKFTDFSGYQT